MTIHSATLLASLLLPPGIVHSAQQSALSPASNENETIRQYSIYAGIQTAGTYQNLLLTTSTRYGIDPSIVHQSTLAHLDKPMDIKRLKEEFTRVGKLYENALRQDEAELEKTFMLKNAKRPGVTVLDNGIQYTVETHPEGSNQPFTQAKIASVSTISGNCGCSMMEQNIADFGIPAILGQDIDRVTPGRKWILHLPFHLLPQDEQQHLQAIWQGKCPEYIVLTCTADADDTVPPGPDADIEDDTPANPDDSQNFLWKKDRTAESMARDEALFLRLNDLTPNVTILPNGVRYSYITDPDGHNGSIKNVSITSPQTLAGDSFLSHDHLNIKTTRADGTPIYTHPLIEPYVDDVPEAKKWFFCIPSELIDPESMDWYTQRIGVRPNYILYILEADTQP